MKNKSTEKVLYITAPVNALVEGLYRENTSISEVIKKGNFVLSSGVKSTYSYEYGDLSDAMNEAYCEILLKDSEVKLLQVSQSLKTVFCFECLLIGVFHLVLVLVSCRRYLEG